MERKKEVKESETRKDSKMKNKWWLIPIGIAVIVLIVLLLLHGCGKKYKITLHYGDETIEVDPNFKLTDLEVEGGTISFLVDSDGHIVLPGEKLDPSKEYSAHIIPKGKETVKVTYKVDDKKNTITYQKGAGLLFPKDPVKKGYVFIAWKYEDKDDYPIYMMPVEHDMTLVAVFEKSTMEGGKCTLNCDTNKDGVCDLNCDKNGDGKPDTNIDTDGDGKADLNVDKDNDNKCDLNCDTNKDGKPDTNIDSDGDGKPDTNIDTNGDGKPDTNIDTNDDGKCDKDCKDYIFNDTSQDELYFDCEEIEMGNLVIFFSLNTEDEFLYSKFNGKEAKPDGFDSDGWPYWNLDKYIELDKNIEAIVTFIKTDKTGQKYFITHHVTLVFEKNCDKKDSTEKENDDIPSTDGNVLELNYNCDTPHGVILYWEKDRIQSVTIDGKKANPGKYNEKNFPTYDLREYKGSGKTIYLNAKVTDYENKDYEFTVKLIFSKDCDKNSDVIKDAESTTKTTSTTTTTTKTTPTTTKTTTTTAKNTTTSTSKTTTTTKPVDNGTIKLSASKACLIKGKSITVTADINNALDSTVDWLGDSCLSISSQGNTATITGNNCGAHPIVTGRLHNGAKDTATLNYEDTLSYTVKNSNGATLTPNGDENYEGSNFIITTNVKANMVFNKNSGGQIDSASNTTQFNLDTKGWQGKVTITTSCGQTKTINIEPKVN